jgi:hypothetical protein
MSRTKNPNSMQSLQPWNKLGISRATYFRSLGEITKTKATLTIDKNLKYILRRHGRIIAAAETKEMVDACREYAVQKALEGWEIEINTTT